MTGIVLRSPLPDEAEALTAMVLRSKAHWGYDEAFMAAAAKVLVVPADELHRYTVAADADGQPLGISRVEVDGARASLDKLFIDPKAMGRGVGRLLFDAAVIAARSAGASVMEIESDPEAAPFYERMGAVRVGEAPSSAIPGRMLPLLERPL